MRSQSTLYSGHIFGALFKVDVGNIPAKAKCPSSPPGLPDPGPIPDLQP